MGRVVYQTCTVLRSTPWTEDQSILTLLSKERCLFSALWKRPKRRREGEDLQPNLFQTFQGAMAFNHEGLHKLRQFEVLMLAPSQYLDSYGRLNLLSRIFQWLLGENQGDPQPFSLWQKHQHLISNPTEWVDFLADLLFVLGALPDKWECSQCHQSQGIGTNLHAELVCADCEQSSSKISSETLDWLASRHQGQRWLAPIPPDAKLVGPYLGSFLPEKMWQDPIISKLLPLLQKS